MPFVKLDCGILSSTLWFERTARELFITALLMAEPFETIDAMPQIASDSLDFTGWSVPPGWYGFVPAANVGIIHRACLEVNDDTRAALASLGLPEVGSRSQDFDGRRLVRVDGGFIVLNFIKYRDKDATTADRSRRWRERQKLKQATRVSDTPTRVIRHQAEAEAEASTRSNETIKRPEGKIPAPTKVFLDWFQGEYAKRRHGAKYFVKWEAHSAIVKRLLKGHAPDRLRKHAILLLTTDEEWSSSTDRGIEVLAGKINWLEERLAAWETKRTARKPV